MPFYPTGRASLALRCVVFGAACVLLTFLCGAFHQAQGQPPYYIPPSTLDTVRFERRNIADTASPYDWYEQLTNLPHVLTRESVPRRGVELTLGEYDTLSSHALDEYENYLRDLDVFSAIRFEPETTGGGERRGRARLAETDLLVRTEDAWSLVVDFYNRPPDDRTIWLLQEKNLFGLAKRLSVGGDLQAPSDSLWRGVVDYGDPDLFGTALQLNGRYLFSDPLDELDLKLERPYYSDRSPRAYGGSFHMADGQEHFFFRDRTPGAERFYSSDTNVSTRYDAGGWISFSNHEKDVFRFSAALDYNSVDMETGTPYRRLGDNSVGFFLGISSLGGKYVRLKDYEFTGTRLVRIGGQGRITAGKISPIDGGLDNMVYFGAEAKQSVLWGDFYGFASIQAGTGLRQKQAQFTLQRAVASGALPLGPGTAAARIEQTTIWRWPRYVLRSLAEGNGGLRGYDYLDAFGDNHILFNLEYRLFPVVRITLWDLGLAAFYDLGGAWDQGDLFTATRFRSAAGLGVRLGKSDGINAGFVRLDVAWNFDENKIGGISLGVNESFDVFGTLEYAPPAPYIP